MSDLTTEKEDEKKGAGAAPWMTETAQVGTGFGSGGTGTAGGSMARLLAMLSGPKAIVLGTVVGGLALGMGIVSTIQEPKEPSLSERFNSALLKTEAPNAALPGSEQPGQSALNMAQRANSGFYGDASAQAPAPAADQSKSDPKVDAPADPAAAAGAKGADAAAGGDPAQLAAALTAQQDTKSKLAGGRFGKLSSGLGGGSLLAGGAGMSGGIGGSFKQPLTNSRAGQLQAMTGANRAQVSRGMTPTHNLGSSALKGANAQRLDKMNRAMGSIGTASPDAAAATHSQQWEAATPTGNSISGGGASGNSIGSGGQFSGDEGTGNGNPLAQPTPSGGYQPNSVPNTGPGKNQTPYQNQLMMAQGMLLLASVIIAVVGIMAIIRNATATNPWTAVAAAALTVKMKILVGIAIGLATGAAAIGASIGSQYGQAGQGQIITIGGGVTAATGIAALLLPQMPAWVMVLGAIGGLAASMMGMLKH